MEIRLFLLFILFVFASCKDTKKMDEKENYPYGATVTSVKNYPIEVHTGYLATKEAFITGFENAGIEESGWHTDRKKVTSLCF
jgi:hypothetical protein